MKFGSFLGLAGLIVRAMPEVGDNGHPINPNVKICAQTKLSYTGFGALMGLALAGRDAAKWCPKNAWGVPCRVATYVIPAGFGAAIQWVSATSSNSCYDVMKYGEYPAPAQQCPTCRHWHRQPLPGW